MLTLDKTRNLEVRGGLDSGHGGEDMIGGEKREGQVAANGGKTPWSTGTKLQGRECSVPRRIVRAREHSCLWPARVI